MAEVVPLPGVFLADMEPRRTVGDVLSDAANAGLKDVVVVGRTIGGEVVVLGTPPDADTAIGLMMRGVHNLAEAAQVNATAEGSAS